MLDFTQFDTLQISITTIVKMVFYFVLGAYAIFSGILYYHWSSYGTDVKVTLYTFIVYFFTTIPLFIIMGILAFNI
jgi:hypothetical protein